MRAVVLAGLGALIAAGCMKTSEKFCAMHDDPRCPTTDGPIGNTCASSSECAAPTPVCDVAGDKTCVACLSNTDCMAATAPVCSAVHTCGGCRVHDDCASSACMPDGSCAAPTDVAYVDTVGGSGSGTCLKNDPCMKVSQGLMTLKKVIKLTGPNDEGVMIDDRAAGVTILGGLNAQMFRNSGIVLDVKGSTNLTVVDVVIGSTVATNTTGISLSAAASGTLELRRVRVQNNNAGAVRIQDGTLRMFDSMILGNLGGGVTVSTTALGYVIRNNFILGNGKATGVNPGPSGTGGALLESVNGVFEFNTVALNSSSGTKRPGLHCEGAANSATSNIVVGNTDQLNGTQDGNQINTANACAFGDTLKLGNGATLGFVSYGDPVDFHLTAASPTTVRDAAGDCGAVVPTDYDREPRPFGPACDLGADEYRPAQ